MSMDIAHSKQKERIDWRRSVMERGGSEWLLELITTRKDIKERDLSPDLEQKFNRWLEANEQEATEVAVEEAQLLEELVELLDEPEEA